MTLHLALRWNPGRWPSSVVARVRELDQDATEEGWGLSVGEWVGELDDCARNEYEMQVEDGMTSEFRLLPAVDETLLSLTGTSR
jgi:hypothetical protein